MPQDDRVRSVLYAGLRIEDGKDLHRCLDGSLHHDVHAAEHLDWFVEKNNTSIQRDKTGRAQICGIDVNQGQTDAARGNEFHEWSHRFHRHDLSHHVFTLELV